MISEWFMMLSDASESMINKDNKWWLASIKNWGAILGERIAIIGKH